MAKYPWSIQQYILDNGAFPGCTEEMTLTAMQGYAASEVDRLLDCMRGKTIDLSLNDDWEDLTIACGSDDGSCEVNTLHEGSGKQSLLDYVRFNAKE